MARKSGQSHALGMGNGSLIEYDDGLVDYRPTGKLLPAFRVAIADVRGFSVRKVTRDDKKRLGASSLQQVLVVQGLGTTLAEVAVNYGTAQKIEEWFRAHPLFGSSAPASNQAGPGASLADELAKLAGLRDSGVLTPDEFEAAKSRLLK